MRRLVFVLAFLSSSAFAEDLGHKIDFTQVLTDPDGKPFTECIKLSEDKSKCVDEKELTLGWVAMQSLNVIEQGINYSDSNKRGTLALKVYKSAGMELSEDEITLIKNQMPKRYSPVVVAKAATILNSALK